MTVRLGGGRKAMYRLVRRGLVALNTRICADDDFM